MNPVRATNFFGAKIGSSWVGIEPADGLGGSMLIYFWSERNTIIACENIYGWVCYIEVRYLISLILFFVDRLYRCGKIVLTIHMKRSCTP